MNSLARKARSTLATFTVGVLALSAALVGAQLASADPAAATQNTDKCVVETIHHAEESHQERKYSQVIPGKEATSHPEYRYQTRTKVYGEIEHKYIKSTYNFVDGGTTKVNGQTVSGHWVGGNTNSWRAIPDSVINAVWGSGGIPSQYIGGSESNPKGSVNLTTYGGPNVNVSYYASVSQTDAGWTAWGPWSAWSTTNPGASNDTRNVESKQVSDNNAIPAKTIFYLPGGGQSDTNTDANWTKETPVAPWVKIEERKVVDKAAWDENVYGPCVIETFAAATASDVCGVNDDKLNVPADTDQVDYQTTDNRVNGVGSVDVKAVAKANLEFKKDAVTSWKFKFTNELCPTEITTFAGVTFSDTCDIKDDKVNVPADTDQIDYQVIDNRVNGVGDVTVNAVAKVPYFFTKDAVTTWKHTFTNEPCPIIITTFGAVKASDVCGIDKDTLGVPADTDQIDYQTVDNRKQGVGTVGVTMVGKAPYVFAAGTQTSWTFTFTNEACKPSGGVDTGTFEAVDEDGGLTLAGYIYLAIIAAVATLVVVLFVRRRRMA